MNVVETSEKAKTIVSRSRINIDYETIPEGKSIIFNIDSINERSLRTSVSKASKRLGKIFRCVKHPEHGVYEIAHIKGPVESVAEEKEEKNENNTNGDTL